MSALLSPFMPSVAEFSPVSSPELDLHSLFEQCGIPLGDLGAQLGGFGQDSGTISTWYEGHEPSTDDIVELVDDNAAASISSRHSTDDLTDLIKSGEMSVSPPPRSAFKTPKACEADAFISLDNENNEHATLPCVDPATSSSSRPRSPNSCLSTPPSSQSGKKDNMDYYPGLQQAYFNGAQLSSPTSMISSPCDNDSFPYTPEISPQFGNWQAQDYNLSHIQMDGEMRRSWSTPFPNNRRATPLSQCLTEDASNNDYAMLDAQVVPASDNGQWGNNGDYLIPQQRQQSVSIPSNRFAANNVSRTMKRKTRPNPIATQMPYTSSPIAQTAPLERPNSMRAPIERPPLSSKRSFEDFSDITNPALEIPAYRQIATPTLKRPKSNSDLNSPYMDEPLFSPTWDPSAQGLALSLDPEQLLLSSPPYSQAEFCSSPSYTTMQNPRSISNFIVPQQLTQQPEPCSPLASTWSQRQSYTIPQQLAAQTPMSSSVPRSLNYGTPRGMNVPKPRRAPVAKNISFCNFTAADKKTILSGVAPSGSNKKTTATKALDMQRSRSSSAIPAN